MKFFKELFDYNHQANQTLIAHLELHKEKLSERSVRLMSHIIDANEVWNSRVLAKKNQFTVWQVHTVETWADLDKANNETSLKIIDEAGFEDVITYTNSLGDTYKNSVRDILFQVINHSTYHRGQIAMDCRKTGIEPLNTDYILYKRDQHL
jgi:uncharacterized damage-inducible protein DinB